MKTRIFSVLALAAAVSMTACAKDEGGDATTENADTSVVQGTDTVQQPAVVPTQDTVVTTTTTETDTIKGDASDSAATDTTKRM